jgi:hypothetical protein
MLSLEGRQLFPRNCKKDLTQRTPKYCEALTAFLRGQIKTKSDGEPSLDLC